MKVIDEVSQTQSLSEAGQGFLEMKFAIYNKDTQKVITPFCKCKDYFNDAFWAKYTKRDVIKQYGFTFKKDDDQGLFDRDTVFLAIRFNNNNAEGTHLDVQQDKLDAILSLINKFDKGNNFNLTKGEIAEDNKHFIIEFDIKWTRIPYIISALFMLLRMGYHYDGKTDVKEFYFKKSKNFISPNDEMYFNSTVDIVGDLEKGIIDTTQKYTDYTTQGTAHNSSGIVSYKYKYRKIPAAEIA